MELLLFFATNPPQHQMPPGGCIVQAVPLVLIFVLFWFLIIRPQRKQQQEHQNMINSLRSGDKVITNSGIIGEIREVYPQFFVLEIAPKVKVRILRESVAKKLPEGFAIEKAQRPKNEGKK